MRLLRVIIPRDYYPRAVLLLMIARDAIKCRKRIKGNIYLIADDMGTAGSKDLPYGVPINPRIDYANLRSKKGNKIVRIDAKPLVHLKHGTVRYRYVEEDSLKKEKPFEGTQLNHKHNYFYHHRFKPQGPSEDESWKYCYVYKGPERACQKRLYYVFSKGLKVNNEGFVEPNYKPEEQSFQRPIFYKMDGHIYMDIIFLYPDKSQNDVPEKEALDNETESETRNVPDKEAPDNETESETRNVPAKEALDKETESEDMNVGKYTNALDPDNNRDGESLETDSLTDIEVELPVSTTIAEIQVKIGRKLVKPAAHIHLYQRGAELRSKQKLSELTQKAQLQENVRLLLHLK